MIELRFVFENRDRESMNGAGQMSSRPDRVVTAPGDAKQTKSNQQNDGTAHAVLIVASGDLSKKNALKAL